MADNKYKYPPAPPNGKGTFSDNIVGFQLVDGGGLTQANFEFSTNVVEKVNRTFDTGVFSGPISLNDININSVEESKQLFLNNFRVYPNYDISQVTGFALYGSIQKRLSLSIVNIISYFPAAIEVNYHNYDLSYGNTAFNIDYDEYENTTTLEIDVKKFKNPFDIEYSVNAERNLSVRPVKVDEIRNLKKYYNKYSLYIDDLSNEHKIIGFIPTNNIGSGSVEVTIEGNPFSGVTETDRTLLIKPSNKETDRIFNDNFDEVEKFLINRNTSPLYTAKFEVLKEDNNGKLYKDYDKVNWKIQGLWNLDIKTNAYTYYLEKISRIGKDIDDFRTNLISRFLTAGALKDFDTSTQKFESILQIYGRSFDEIKKFIDSLAYVNSVNYRVKNDIPSELLKNLSATLGWNPNPSPISNNDFLRSVFDTSGGSSYPGQAVDKTPLELSYQYYRNLILNSAYLFKSKGTRRSIESLLRMIGAPQALIDFNEIIYIADTPISMDNFNTQYASISGGTKEDAVISFDNNVLFQISGVTYKGYKTEYKIRNVDTIREDYPVDVDGYPIMPRESDSFFFQQGSGWYEQTTQHRSKEEVDIVNSTFIGQNPNIQTNLESLTYGKKYTDRYENFPYMNIGFNLSRVVDNKKSWTTASGARISKDGGLISNYFVPSEKLVVNSKRIDLSLNMGQGLVYDIWDMSRKYNYPFKNTSLSNPYPSPNGVDWTVINPKPNNKSFVEFASTFYKNMINVKNRMYITDGKGGGYPTLQYLYWRYMNSDSEVNIPTNKFTYQKMIDFTNDIGDYWIKLVEQMIPATTLWTGGQKFENSVLHRQKVAWKIERPEEEVVEPCSPCEYNGSLYETNCLYEYIECDVTITNPAEILTNSINDAITTGSCDPNSVISYWYVDVRLSSSVILQSQFYTGYGDSDYPSSQEWLDAVEEKLGALKNSGLTFTLDRISSSNNILTVFNLDCDSNFRDKTLSVNVGVDIEINC
jgi:hypothetical protein